MLSGLELDIRGLEELDKMLGQEYVQPELPACGDNKKLISFIIVVNSQQTVNPLNCLPLRQTAPLRLGLVLS